jgi:general stress protein 26
VETIRRTETAPLTPSEARARVLAIMRLPWAGLMLAHGDDTSFARRPLLRSRPESTALMWFGARIDDDELHEIEAAPVASVWLHGTGERAIVTGDVLGTRQRHVVDEIWAPWWKTWFMGPTDPGLAIVVLMPTHAVYWDLSQARVRSCSVQFERQR